MGNVQGQHGDPARKHSEAGHGLVFNGDKHQREMSPFDPIGPVAITTRTEAQSPPSRTPHRPRSTTESGPRRHVTIDYGTSDQNQKVDEESSIIKNKEHIKKMPTIIKYSGQGKEVYLCGTFNGWQKLKMSRTQKDFVAMIELGEGDHEYKFLVDGQWVTDPNTAIIENNSGFKNNLIHVQKGDFDAFEALDMDSATVSKAQGLKAAKLRSVQPQSVFGQEMPHFNTEIGPQVVSSRKDLSGPPILPPHLLQVILNKDTPMSCEPTLLPEPNHVMLNHLYALSIKDGVMVLSTTQRFKKKYVTSLLYKPMGTRIPEDD